MFGSINADTSLFVESLPAPGETVHARRIHRDNGGKGANQACAAAFAGASTAIIGCVGDDLGGARSRTALRDAGVDDTGVVVVDAPTGSATITVDMREAENTIVIDAGANAFTTAERAADVAGAAAVLLQLEIPMEAVTAAVRHATGIVVLNAAPAAQLPDDMLRRVDVLVVNETELDVVSRPFREDGSHTEKAASIVGPATVVVTLGGDGALIVENGAGTTVPAPPVNPVDTTGAGDCFVGTLAARLVAGASMVDSVVSAVEAASRSTSFDGARGYLSR